MNRVKRYIALDLGGSARAVVGTFDGERLSLEVLHRFPNPYVRTLDWVYWDVLALFAQVVESLQQIAGQYRLAELASLGVDAMGGAFALLDARGELLGNPRYSRLPERADLLSTAYRRVAPEQIFRQTGLQPAHLKALSALLGMQMADDPRLAAARTFLMLPDLINYWLIGRMACEYTIASTSHLLAAESGDWAYPLLAAMGLPARLLPELVQPGQVLANLHTSVTAESGLPALPVVATVSHDTAAAVAAVPARQSNCAYLSSGTWGMVGVELEAPILTAQALHAGFANEGGAGGRIRFISNSLNLWLLQSCRNAWTREGWAYSWETLQVMATESEPFLAVIDANDTSFFLPEHMPRAIQAYCRDTGQMVPQTPGQITRVVLESLALLYRDAIDGLAGILGWKPSVLHIVGGGGRNRLLNQFAANATGLPVLVGPYEATAAGNILLQMIALGDLSALAEGRELIRRSFPGQSFDPEHTQTWNEHYLRHQHMLRHQIAAPAS